MPFTIQHILLVSALLLLVSVAANKASSRFGVPSLLLFLRLECCLAPMGQVGCISTMPSLRKPSANVLVILIERDGEQIVPSGATVLRPGDHVRVRADPNQLPALNARLLEFNRFEQAQELPDAG